MSTVNTSNDGRRRYHSPLREAQAEATRERILDAGLTLFAERGYPATTVTQIAAAAGVSAETIYSSVGSKRGIIDALLEAIDVDERPVEYARAAVIERGGAPRAVLEVYAETVGTFWAAHSRLVEVLRKGVGDPEIGEAWVEREERRRRIFVDAVGAWPPGSLRAGVDLEQAADVAWALSASDIYARLVERRGWTLEAYVAWLTGILTEQLLAGGADASAASRRRPRRRP